MPTYDYRCDACSHQFEQFHAMSAKGPSKCPECGGKLQRLIGGGAGVHVKGDGPSCTSANPACGPAAGGCGTGCCPISR